MGARRFIFDFWALDHQLPPEGDWKTWVILGGRGAGKTRAGAEWVRAEVEAERAGHVALVAPTLNDAREVMIEGPSGLLATAMPGWRPRYEPSRRRLVWPNGAEAFAFSAEDPESLRGPQFDLSWCDEFAAWRLADETLNMLEFALRLGAAPRGVVTTTPKATAAVKRLMARPDVVMTHAPTAANAHNLAPEFMTTLQAMYGGTRLAQQELEGLVVEDHDAGVWTVAHLHGVHTAPPERFDRRVVAVDPPASVGRDADACGLVAVGRCGDRAYVLEDATVQGQTPQAWARAAVACARRWQAEIVAEGNQGGEMVRTLLQLEGAEVPVTLVHARLSKRARAEPVAALYEQGRVKHTGQFPHLEQEMLDFGQGAQSPDRVDALVWAVSHLMLAGGGQPRLRVL